MSILEIVFEVGDGIRIVKANTDHAICIDQALGDAYGNTALHFAEGGAVYTDEDPLRNIFEVKIIVYREQKICTLILKIETDLARIVTAVILRRIDAVNAVVIVPCGTRGRLPGME